MKLKLQEDAVGAGDVCATSMPLFATMAARDIKQRAKIPTPKIIKFGNRKIKIPKLSFGIKEAMENAFGDQYKDTANPEFDSTEIIDKLKSIEKGDAETTSVVSFGLEDDNGDIVRVSVPSEQGDDFERALQSILANKERDNEKTEIAEILFQLKDDFEFVDVVWPNVVEDEEEVQTLDATPGENGNVADSAGQGEDLGLDDSATVDPNPDAGASSMLTQVIDMMKADAEARKADAEARKAEARNRETEAAIHQANARVKHEEQLLDMDAFNKAEKDQHKEATRLAQLSHWKKKMSTDSDDDQGYELGAQENEEHHVRHTTQPKLKSRVHPHEVAKFILNRMR